MSLLPYGTYIGPVARGPAVVEILGDAQFGAVSTGASIPTSGSLACTIVGAGFSSFVFGLTTTQIGNVAIQPFLDIACLIPAATATTQALLAGTASVFRPSVTAPFAALVLTVSNGTAGAPSTISNIVGLMQGQ